SVRFVLCLAPLPAVLVTPALHDALPIWLRDPGRVRDLHEPGPVLRAHARGLRHLRDQVLVLGLAEGAAHPLRDPSAGPGAALEALPDGPRVAGPVGGVHAGQ